MFSAVLVVWLDVWWGDWQVYRVCVLNGLLQKEIPWSGFQSVDSCVASFRSYFSVSVVVVVVVAADVAILVGVVVVNVAVVVVVVVVVVGFVGSKLSLLLFLYLF